MNDGWSIIPNWIARGERLDAFEKLVYLALLSRANEEGFAWPSMPTLAEDAGCSERTVQERLRRLSERGLVGIEKRFREDGSPTSNLYRVEVFRPRNSRTTPPQELHQGGAGVADKERTIEERTIEEHSSSPDGDGAFDRFWNVYPRKAGKQAAVKAWAKAIKSTSPDVIVDGASRFAADPNLPEKQFIPHPATWLNAGRWDDEPLPGRKPEQQQHANADWDWMTR